MWRLWELLKWGVAGSFSVLCMVLVIVGSILSIAAPYILAGLIIFLLICLGIKEWLDSFKDPTKDP